MPIIRKALNILSSLKFAIFLLFLVAISCSIGTAIPQSESTEFYFSKYQENPLLGIINSNTLIKLELNHVYSSSWFITILFLLGLSLIICSWKRQWPRLKSAINWVYYKKPKQILKLAIAETVDVTNPSSKMQILADYLTTNGWQIKKEKYTLSARKGVIGRFGPPLVHFGLILLMFGATLGSIKGQKIERFISPGKSIDLISPNKENKLSFELKSFNIQRSPDGKPEQFRSTLKLVDNLKQEPVYKEISVNSPLRYNGLTVYQADWSLNSIIIKIGKSPKLQLPLSLIPELGEQVWGVVLPSINENQENILITVDSEDGPVRVFNSKGKLIGIQRPNTKAIKINELSLNVLKIEPSSGILIKYDPGIPLVYLGFAVTLIGSTMSIVSTKLLWAISEDESDSLYVGGLSNRDPASFSEEFPKLIQSIYS